jgi:cell division protein ZapA (FtsZ GTPase activity inhibitor)
MPDGDSQDPQRALRDRIVTLMRANEQARRNPVSDDERRHLKSAASRLDQMLNATADAEREALAGAAERLNRLLRDMQAGKDLTGKVRLRREGKN